MRHVRDRAHTRSNLDGPPRYVPPGPITIISMKAPAGAAGPPQCGRRWGQRVPHHHHHHSWSGGPTITTAAAGVAAGAEGTPPTPRRWGWCQRGQHQVRLSGELMLSYILLRSNLIDPPRLLFPVMMEWVWFPYPPAGRQGCTSYDCPPWTLRWPYIITHGVVARSMQCTITDP